MALMKLEDNVQQEDAMKKECYDEVKKKGISKIICISVNDPNVMKAWGDQLSGAFEAWKDQLPGNGSAPGGIVGLQGSTPRNLGGLVETIGANAVR